MATTKKVAVKKAAAVAAPVVKREPGKINVRVNQSVRILEGEHAGLVGVVQSIDHEDISMQVLIQGVKDDKPVDVCETFYPVQVEANQ